MSIVRIQTGAKEPIEVLAVDVSRARLTGLTNLKVYVRRVSDGAHFDWSDDTFRTSPSQILETLSEINATRSPGAYKLDTASHDDGFDTSAITNPNTDDTYRVTVIQDGAPQTAINFPQVGEIKVGQWADNIDQAISDNATPAEVQAELRAIRLHQLVSVNPGAVQPGTGTYIKQIIDNLARKPEYVVLQTYSYNEAADRLDGIVWVEYGNLVLAAPTSCTVKWYDRDGNLAWSLTDSSPDGQGFFKIEKSGPGLTSDELYYAVAEVDVAGVGTVSGGKGNFTF